MAGRRGCKKTMGFYITWLWYHDYDGVYGIFLNNIILWEDNDDGGDDDDDTKKQWETQWFIIRFPLIHYEHGKALQNDVKPLGDPLVTNPFSKFVLFFGGGGKLDLSWF